MRLALSLLALIALLAGCADGGRDLKKPVEPLGDFKLGHAIVVAPNLVKGPVSRDASKAEWIAAMDSALEERFRRYEGDTFYHLGVSVEGYVLAQPGIPVVLSPKSVLIVRVTVFDDATQQKLNAEAKEITALEAPSADTLVGSGLTQSKQEQMTALSRNAALLIETWLRRQMRAEGWFRDDAPDRVAATAPAAAR